MTTTATALTLNTREAAHAFATLATITPAKTTKPVLQQVKVTPDAHGFALNATSLDISVEMFLTGPGSEGAPFLVPAKEMAQLLKQIDTDDVELVVDGTRVEVRSGQGVFTLLADNVDQFPSVDLSDAAAPTCTMSGASLAHAVESVSFALAKEETRYAINGALFQVGEDTLTAVGTDGRRLAVCEVECNGIAEARAVIPAQVLKAIQKNAASAESVGVTIDGTRAVFTMPGMVLSAQLLEDRFPIWEQVIPKAGMQLTFEREQLMSALARVATICRGDVPMVRMAAEEATVTLSTESASVGRGDETLELECVAEEPVAISVNPDYLIDALKVAEADQIPVMLSDEATPMVWSLGGGVRYVLMPMGPS